MWGAQCLLEVRRRFWVGSGRPSMSRLADDDVCVLLKRKKAESEAQRGKPKGTLESESRNAIPESKDGFYHIPNSDLLQRSLATRRAEFHVGSMVSGLISTRQQCPDEACL